VRLEGDDGHQLNSAWTGHNLINGNAHITDAASGHRNLVLGVIDQ